MIQVGRCLRAGGHGHCNRLSSTTIKMWCKPFATTEQAALLASSLFGLKIASDNYDVEVKELPSYDDQNFHIALVLKPPEGAHSGPTARSGPDHQVVIKLNNAQDADNLEHIHVRRADLSPAVRGRQQIVGTR